MSKEYYLGLDVGTNSVGWAVTDTQYNLCKFKKKDMWGIRLFESATTAEKRRLKRGSRRRIERKKQRIDLLQELFAPEIQKIDPTFFIRLNESRLHIEDKSSNFKYPLFIEKEYSDIEYYKEFPTIFHLRKYLIESEEKHDIRLIYLALHNIIKKRGHFLIDGDLRNAKQLRPILENLLINLKEEQNLCVELSKTNKEEFEKILQDKSLNKSDRAKKLKNLFELSNELEKNEKKSQQVVIENFCKFIVGNKGDACKFLRLDKEELEVNSFSFSESKYEEIINILEEQVPEKTYLFVQMKAMYDWNVLVDILEKEDYLSFAKVKQYEKHKNNLSKLRNIMLNYCTKEEYNRMFNDEKEAGSYTVYVGKLKKNNKKYCISKKINDEKGGNKRPSEEFYKYLKKILEKIEPSEEDLPIVEQMIWECDNQTLLPIQRNKDNGVIPHQVHELELKKILENAKKHYSFLGEIDEFGYSVEQKIESIFKFRIPYYVGPLSTRHQEEGANVWMVRREGRTDKIYPWNIEKIVDFEKSNENFIRRMTNKCTYLVGEDVLPKNSLLYSKYMVLNELNNVKARGKKLPTSVKQRIFEDLFQNKARVTGKNLLEYLKVQDENLQIDDLSGFDKDFHTSLKSYLDFKKQVFGDEIEKENTQRMVEDIIKWITIYGNDKKMLRNVIDINYPNQITEEQFKKIKGFQYSGWGNFSKMFLEGVWGSDTSTGETFNIISALWETDNNLMQLLSKKFTFSEQIDNFNSDKIGKIDKISYDSTVKEMFLSPENKRAVWQTIQISEEIKKVMGCEPKKIFVEMARGGEKVKERTKSRKAQLLELYAACEEDCQELIKEIESREERDFSSMKLFLYYTQMGKCMYTGESIDLDELLSSNSKWDRDHIYPQSKIKDDSINNLVLVNKKINAKKSNELLSEDIQRKMHGFWLALLNKKLITKSKYDRLTRKGTFTEEELSGFIARQIVETRQSTKAIADIFKQIYSSEVVYVKSSLASDFRKKPLDYLKSRRANDYHHAKDAYLNIVVGNVYNKKFTSNPIQWMKKNRDTNYSLNRVFENDVIVNGETIWEKCSYYPETKTYGGGTLDRIRNIVERDNILYTEYSYCEKGELFNQTIQNKNANPTVQLKKGLDFSKYGGYYSANTSYFSLIEFDDKKGKRARNIIGVPIYIANMLEHSPTAFLQYCEQKGYRNVTILVEKIKRNSLLIINGYPMRIRGENEVDTSFKRVIQLKIDREQYKLIRNIEKYLEKNSNYAIDEKRDHITHEKVNELYEVLLNKMKKFNKKGMADLSDKIESAKSIFIESNDLISKVKLLDEMLTLLRCDNKIS